MKDFEEQDLFGIAKRAKTEKKKKDSEPALNLDFSDSTKSQSSELSTKQNHVENKISSENKTAPLDEKNKSETEHKKNEQTPPQMSQQHKKPIVLNKEMKKQGAPPATQNTLASDNSQKTQPNQPEQEHKEKTPLKSLHELKEMAKTTKNIEEKEEKEHPQHDTTKQKVASVILKPNSPIIHHKENSNISKHKTHHQETSENPKQEPSQSSKGIHYHSKQIHPQHKTPQKQVTITEGTSIGQILQEARSKIGLSVDQVAIETRIKKSYIEALERDDLEQLPSRVYVKAYARRLCQQYGLDETIAANAIKTKEQAVNVPEDVLIELEKSKQINLEKQKKLSVFQTTITISILAIIAIALVTVYFFHKKENSTPPQQVLLENNSIITPEEMDKKLRELIVSYPTGNMTELNAP